MMEQDFLNFNEKKVDVFFDLFQKVSHGMMRTVWDFSEHRAKQVFLVIDRKEMTAKSFVNINGKLIDTEKLHESNNFPKFNPDPKRIDRLSEFFAADTKELYGYFKRFHKGSPRRIWLQHSTEIEKNPIVFDFTPIDTELSDLKTASSDWRAKINGGKGLNFL